MNLAHVGYYFADLLSVLESGGDKEGWTREPLRIVAPENASGELPPARLYLPSNLYVIGTVNVDETTHAFSPKVLDRAFTIELTDVDFTGYPPLHSAEPHEEKFSAGLRQDLLRRFTRDVRFTAPSKAELAEFVYDRPDIRLHLQTLNQQLEPFGLHFGYRVFDEIVSFLICADENQIFDGADSYSSAFDAAVLMKVLPKFHGSRSKLEQPLIGVIGWCLSPESPQPNEVRETLAHTHGEVRATSELRKLGYQYPKTAARVIRMLDDLSTTGFAAFG
jgi:5-methylcytosine-specific restriction enzyme B